MGIDATIFIKSQKGADALSSNLEFDMPRGFSIKVLDKDPFAPAGSTHEVDCNSKRYYGPHYERGPWPEICGVLMALHSDPDVEKVWYGGDCEDQERLSECPPEKVLEISSHYMKNGHRPYNKRTSV